MKNPELTICVTTYNRWDMCLKALQSVCGQEGVSFEVILVDDCSSEPMPWEAAEFIEANGVRFIRHDQNKGLAAARNTAIEHALGEYFSFCDDDDQWPQGHASGLINAIQDGGPNVGMAVGVARFRKIACHKIFGDNQMLSNLFLAGFTPPVGAQIYKTDLVKQVGGYSTGVKSGVDHDLWINLLTLNPHVAVCWGEPVIVGKDPVRDRMTTNETLRRQGIQKSLKIWRPKLVASLGEDFFRHFGRSYDQYLDFKFFTLAVRNKKYVRSIMKLSKWNVLVKLFDVFFQKMNKKKKCNLFPAFKYDLL